MLLTDGASNAGRTASRPPTGRRAAACGSTRSGSGPRIRLERPPCGLQFVGNEPGDTAVRPGASAGAAAAAAVAASAGRSTRRRSTAVAEATGGEYYPAESADQLHTVFENLPTNLITKHEVVEISVAVRGAGTVLVALAILLGQAWRPLP